MILLALLLQAVAVEAPSAAVEFGKPFPLVVKRSWNRTESQPAWDDRSLAPLVVTPKGTERKTVGDSIEETRRYEARAFSKDEVEVPSLRLRLEVKSALADPKSPVERPPGPFEERIRWARWMAFAAAAAVVCAALFVAAKRWRAKPAPPPPPQPPVPADERALARLAALRRREPASLEELQAYYVEASSIVREYLEERFAIRAPEMTTEEFLASPATEQALETAHRTLLARFLAHCDFVKFARGGSSAAERQELLSSAEKLVRETRRAAR